MLRLRLKGAMEMSFGVSLSGLTLCLAPTCLVPRSMFCLFLFDEMTHSLVARYFRVVLNTCVIVFVCLFSFSFSI